MSLPAGPPDQRPFRGGGRTIAGALVIAALGATAFVIALVVDAPQALASYLIAYTFTVTVAIGLLAFVMGAHAMSATWPTAIRRLAELAIGALPLIVILYVPLFWSAQLYPWAHPENIADQHLREIVLHKRPVMNAPFFFSRAILFLVFWTIVGELLRRHSLGMDRPGAPDLRDRLRALSCVFLPLVGLTATFAAFDWIMSLSPDFYSTMYGLYVLSGGFVAALGLVAVMMLSAQKAGFLVGVTRSHWYAIGRLLFAFLIFWAYTGFFQYLLIWIGNKPVEARFYVERFNPRDMWTSHFLVWGHFFAPWLILLSYSVKRRRATVTALGAWLLACHYVDIHWLVGARRPVATGGGAWHWPDAAALLLVGGLCVAFAVWRQRGKLPSAAFAPDYADALLYESR
jgi:hypothetical protein